MPKYAEYRPVAITQRDGSELQNSNCRMAAIATGIDFHTLGHTKSTGATMRARQGDQSGGTGSDDAKRAWASYKQVLDIEDGKTFEDALDSLRAGHLIHLDVWAATSGSDCISGSGGYGHTIAVAPDHTVDGWAVADPWCKPGRWQRIRQPDLKRAAEDWGRKVRGQTRGRSALAQVAKQLMSRYYPGNEDPDPVPPVTDETSGPQEIMYTITRSQAETEGDNVSSHLTVTDKDRVVRLAGDGTWRPFRIKDSDGVVKDSITPEPGIYILQYQLRGTILDMPNTRLEVRIQRYPIDPLDNGTAGDSITLTGAVTTAWFGTRLGKVEVKASGDYSTSIGIDYRYRGGKLDCKHRVLKFVRQVD